MSEEENTTPLIYERMVQITKQIGAIEKDRNAASAVGGYAFRGIDAVLAALQPCLVNNGVCLTVRCGELDRGTYAAKDRTMTLATIRVEYTFTCAEDGSSVVCIVIGEGADTADKSVAKAISSAMKSMVFQTFSTPTEEATDNEDEHRERSGQEAQAPQPQPQAAPPATAGPPPQAAYPSTSGPPDPEPPQPGAPAEAAPSEWDEPAAQGPRGPLAEGHIRIADAKNLFKIARGRGSQFKDANGKEVHGWHVVNSVLESMNIATMARPEVNNQGDADAFVTCHIAAGAEYVGACELAGGWTPREA